MIRQGGEEQGWWIKSYGNEFEAHILRPHPDQDLHLALRPLLMVAGDGADISAASRRGRRQRTSHGRSACGVRPGQPLVVTAMHRIEIRTTVGGDSGRQGGGVLPGDEDASDHQVELDGVEDAVAVVGLLGDCGERTGLRVVGDAGIAIADRTALDCDVSILSAG